MICVNHLVYRIQFKLKLQQALVIVPYFRFHNSNSAPLQSKFSTEEALVGLQKELQHSLTSNRTKREEIQQLRARFEEAEKHLVAKENEIERLEMLVRKQEVNTCNNINLSRLVISQYFDIFA